MAIRALLLHDVEWQTEYGVCRWAYANRTYGLWKYVPPGWDVSRVSIRYMLDNPSMVSEITDGVDVALNLDYQSVGAIKPLLGKIPVVTSFNKDRSRNTEYWELAYSLSDYIICNNQDRYLWAREEGYDRVCYISNGVDCEFWSGEKPFEDRPIDVAWCGSASPKKGKRYDTVVSKLPGLLPDRHCSIRPIVNSEDRAIYSQQQQKEWYGNSKIIICASSSEGGGPSSLMEAMACGCIPVTTRIGGVPEFGVHGHNCYIVDEPTPEAFAAAVKCVLADQDPQSLSDNAASTMKDRYAYGSGIERHFYDLMGNIAGGHRPGPFEWTDHE